MTSALMILSPSFVWHQMSRTAGFTQVYQVFYKTALKVSEDNYDIYASGCLSLSQLNSVFNLIPSPFSECILICYTFLLKCGPLNKMSEGLITEQGLPSLWCKAYSRGFLTQYGIFSFGSDIKLFHSEVHNWSNPYLFKLILLSS